MSVVLSRPTPNLLRIRYTSGYGWLFAKVAVMVAVVALAGTFGTTALLPVYVALAAVAASFWIVTWTTVEVEISRDRRELRESRMVLLGLAEAGPQETLRFDDIECVRTRLTMTHRTDAYRVDVVFRSGESRLLAVPYLGIKSCSEHAATIAEFVGVPLGAPTEVQVRSGLFGAK